MVRWPGTIRAGARSQFMWAFWDVMPTLAELAGTTVPNARIDGVSIVPTLMGQSQPPKDYVYFTWRGTGVPPLADSSLDGSGEEETDDAKQKAESGYGIRSGDWKGVVANCADAASGAPSDKDAMLLFDLASDPFEARNESLPLSIRGMALMYMAEWLLSISGPLALSETRTPSLLSKQGNSLVSCKWGDSFEVEEESLAFNLPGVFSGLPLPRHQTWLAISEPANMIPRRLTCNFSNAAAGT